MGEVLNAYKEFLLFFPSYVSVLLNLLILTLLIVIYSIFIWKFYRVLAKKNTINLNLSQHSNSQNAFFSRLFTSAIYFLENIIIAPLLIFIAFAVFTFFLILLSSAEVSQILIISAVVIAAVRMTSYYKEDLARDIAKLLPFTLLAVAVLNPATFSQTQYIEKIISHLSQLPVFFSEITYYLIFIILLEILLRFFDFLFSLVGIEEIGEEKRI